ncbi:hypothetical protein FIU83_05195 [Halomonas sp. THAF5a]|uniref:DUF4007 family protein n=1 Tax=Halomonas sp. THAF5a TaxID=2587844 RepID=UPI0012692C64|nr:DUF4007 family protein [Halomonas sp. THAF5a]QFU01026.1 hypothetical protein FIU83_05195 [Halomonas sp. THAF5a]
MTSLKPSRLPLSFHMTFQPERQYLNALLTYVQSMSGSMLTSVMAISEATGIPTGKSTGKVKPLIQYAQGMGLLDVEARRGSKEITISLTPFAKTVLHEDPHLLEETTQWALHLLLCRRNGGAEAWYAVFVDAAFVLGRRFREDQFVDFLNNRFGWSRDAVGPLLRTYTDPAALAKASAIVEEDNQVLLRKVPLQPAFHDTVAALLFMAWDAAMANDTQVALRELEESSGLITATGWGQEEQTQFLIELESAGFVRVDRQTGAPILTRFASTAHVLQVMYDRLV